MPTPKDPFPIYKDGETRMIHSVDYGAWAAHGWSTNPPVEGKPQQENLTEKSPLPDSLTPAQDTAYVQRQQALQALFDEPNGWRSIERIAKPLSINKPATGWEDAIPLILEAEGLTP